MFKLYRKPEANELVIIGADPAEGGDSYCAAVAKSRKQHDSFLVFRARMESTQFGHELYKMAMYAKKETQEYPLLGIERNIGMAAINVLQTYNYPKMFRMPKIGQVDNPESDNKIGWVTNTATRPKMLDDLSLALRQRATRIYDADTIKELMSFIRNDRTGRPEAASGTTDDLVFAEAIAWQLHQLAPATTKEEKAAKIAQFPKQEIYDKHGIPNV